MKPAKKRKRSENWDSSDKHLLYRLIQEKIEFIEDKNVDTKTCIAKRAAWKEILVAFNKRCNTKRDFSQIHSQWRRIKMDIKNRQSNSNGVGNGKESASNEIIKTENPMNEDARAYVKEEFILDHSDFDYESSVHQESIAHSDDHFKDQYFENPIDEKDEELQHFRNKCEEEIETLRLERSLKIKAFEADERRKEEEHRMKLQYMEEEHQLKMELFTERIS